MDLDTSQWAKPLTTLFSNFGRLGLGFFYAAGLILLTRRQHWDRRLAPLAAVGRMALTNYLLHLVILALIFYRYGLGLWGHIGPTPGIVLALLVFGAQALWSVWWMRRFRFGPVEWLWRSLTYADLQPIRIRSD